MSDTTVSNDNIFANTDIAQYTVIGSGLFDFSLHAMLFNDSTDSEDTETKTVTDRPCKKCSESKRSRYCDSTVIHVGNDCEKSHVIINGHDFRDLLSRITEIEKYIASRELERQIPSLPTDLAIKITEYF